MYYFLLLLSEKINIFSVLDSLINLTNSGECIALSGHLVYIRIRIYTCISKGRIALTFEILNIVHYMLMYIHKCSLLQYNPYRWLSFRSSLLLLCRAGSRGWIGTLNFMHFLSLVTEEKDDNSDGDNDERGQQND